MFTLLKLSAEEVFPSVWETYYDFATSGSEQRLTFDAFCQVKQQSYALLDRAEYLIMEADSPIGVWTYESGYFGPEVQEGKLELEVGKAELGAAFFSFFTAELRRQMQTHHHHRVVLFSAHAQLHHYLGEAGIRPANILDFFEVQLPQLKQEVLAAWVGGFQPETYELSQHRITEIPPEMLTELAKLMTVCANGIMRQDYSWQSVKTPERVAASLDLDRWAGKQNLFVLLQDPEGSLVGMTQCTWELNGTGPVEQRLTGVHPDWQGKGMGKWFKATMIQALLDHLPTVQTFQTASVVGNHPMRHLNEQMGFQPTGKIEWEYVIPIEHFLPA